MFSNQYIVSKDELLKKFITKDFMEMVYGMMETLRYNTV